MIPLCNIEDIQEGQSKGLCPESTSIFLVKKYGKVFGYINKCPHLGLSLEWQQDQFLNNDAELIQCATHGALFNIETGFCVSGPCIEQHLEAIKLVTKDAVIFWNNDA